MYMKRKKKASGAKKKKKSELVYKMVEIFETFSKFCRVPTSRTVLNRLGSCEAPVIGRENRKGVGERMNEWGRLLSRCSPFRRAAVVKKLNLESDTQPSPAGPWDLARWPPAHRTHRQTETSLMVPTSSSSSFVIVFLCVRGQGCWHTLGVISLTRQCGEQTRRDHPTLAQPRGIVSHFITFSLLSRPLRVIIFWGCWQKCTARLIFFNTIAMQS